jgi:hypothetical protein
MARKLRCSVGMVGKWRARIARKEWIKANSCLTQEAVRPDDRAELLWAMVWRLDT